MWSDLEHQFAKQIKSFFKEQQVHFLLALSGGRDSSVLLNLCQRVLLQRNFSILHVHHGPGENQKHRDEALAFMQAKSITNGIEFFSCKSSESLNSEDEMRVFRYSFLQQTREELSLKWPDKKIFIVTAHHAQDQLETQLMNLIRGAGLEGVQAMQEIDNHIFRPLLTFDSRIINQYAESEKLEFCTDPTNAENNYFRNWMRNEWLFLLESQKPGSVFRLQESLNNLVSMATMANEKLSKVLFDSSAQAAKVEREVYEFSSLAEQRRLLYLLVKAHSHRAENNQITRGQIEEIQKRLDKSQKELTFTAAGLKWIINARQITAIKE